MRTNRQAIIEKIDNGFILFLPQEDKKLYMKTLDEVRAYLHIFFEGLPVINLEDD